MYVILSALVLDAPGYAAGGPPLGYNPVALAAYVEQVARDFRTLGISPATLPPMHWQEGATSTSRRTGRRGPLAPHDGLAGVAARPARHAGGGRGPGPARHGNFEGAPPFAPGQGLLDDGGALSTPRPWLPPLLPGHRHRRRGLSAA